jgi:hypothetical protein
VHQWNGSCANKYEKFKALEIATNIKSEHGKAELVYLDGKNEKKIFSSKLGGSHSDVQSEHAGGDHNQLGTPEAVLCRNKTSTNKFIDSGTSNNKFS